MAYRRIAPWLLAVTAALFTQTAQAQDRIAAGPVPGMGSLMPQTSQIQYAPANGQDGAAVPDCESAVSFIDSAVPWTQVKVRFDANYGDHRPSRAEYLFPKSGVAGSPGWWVPEKNVDWQDLVSYIEIAYQHQLSVFLEIPTRFVNPEVNANDWGLSDLNFGVKWAFVNMPGLSLAAQIRGTFPTRAGPGLGAAHYSVEPGLLFYLRPIQWMALEGEARYWLPLQGTDFSGDIVRYGVGLSFLERKYDDFWFTPLIEAVGWTVLGGQEMMPFPDGSGVIRGARGETIANAMAGVRLGFGDNGDIYLGYGRSITGDRWQHDLWRLEFRVRF